MSRQLLVVAATLACAIVLGCEAATFPTNLPKTFKIKAVVQGAYHSNFLNPNGRFLAGGSSLNVFGFIENPSTNPNALNTMGAAVPGSAFVSFSPDYWGPEVAVKVTDPQAVAHFSNESVRAAVWDSTLCGFGYFNNLNTQSYDFPYWIDWMFWNVWQQKGIFKGNETLDGVACNVYEVQGNDAGNFMMIWLNQAKPQVVMWSLSFLPDGVNSSTGGIYASVVVETFVPGANNNPTVPTECQGLLSSTTSTVSPLFERKRRQQSALLAKMRAKQGIEAPSRRSVDRQDSDAINIGEVLADANDFMRKLHAKFV